MIRSVLTVVCLCVLLSACSIGKKPKLTQKFYLLDDLPSAADNDIASAVVIDKITVPDYLNQRNLVLRQQKQQITIANFHSWADDLPLSIQRVLTRDLNRNTEQFLVEENCVECVELSVEIEHFYPTDTGKVLLVGAYSIAGVDVKKRTREHFSFEGALRADGYDEAVFQMRQLLLNLSDSIKFTILRLGQQS